MLQNREFLLFLRSASIAIYSTRKNQLNHCLSKCVLWNDNKEETFSIPHASVLAKETEHTFKSPLLTIQLLPEANRPFEE